MHLNIAAATEHELQAVLAPLISDADGVDPERRQHARAATIESAPPFLASLIARFAAGNQFLSAIQAQGRIGTASSRAHLKTLFDSSDASRRSSIVLALRGIGHRDDLRFFVRVLQNASFDQTSRGYAAVALGHIGVNRAVRYLRDALYGNNPAQNNVCGAFPSMNRALPLITPMRLSRAKEPFDGPDWLFELLCGQPHNSSDVAFAVMWRCLCGACYEDALNRVRGYIILSALDSGGLRYGPG